MQIDAVYKIRKQIHWEHWGVRISAILTAVMGVINIWSAIQPALYSRLKLIENVFPLEIRHGSRIITALAGFAFLLLASNLWRRKKVAWFLTTLLLAVSLVSHLVKGLDFEEASSSLGLLLLLILLRKSFHAESDQPSIWRGVMVLAAALGFTLIYGAVGFYALDRHFSVRYSVWEAIRQSVVMFTSLSDPGLEPITGFGKYFAGSIYVMGVGTISFALLMLIRPVLVRNPASAEQRAQAERIVHQYGRSFLSRAALFPDKSYFFGPDETVIAFAASGRGAMVLGDPIGPPEQIAESILAFRDYCGRKDWVPSFAAVQPDHLDAYTAAGMNHVCIGYEAIVPLGTYSLEGSQNKGVRNTVSRMERSGFRCEVHLPPLGNDLMAALRQISDAWLTAHQGGEMHFSDGWFDETYVGEGPVVVIHSADGAPVAFANMMPEYQQNGLAVDLMRHYPDVERGAMDYLFAQMLLWAKENGYETFSLGLSAIAGVGEKPDDPRIEQALHTISEKASRFFNFRGLRNFKEKFHPRWEPRYLIYPKVTDLPLVITTLLNVHTGGNFLFKFLKK